MSNKSSGRRKKEGWFAAAVLCWFVLGISLYASWVELSFPRKMPISFSNEIENSGVLTAEVKSWAEIISKSPPGVVIANYTAKSSEEFLSLARKSQEHSAYVSAYVYMEQETLSDGKTVVALKKIYVLVASQSSLVNLYVKYEDRYYKQGFYIDPVSGQFFSHPSVLLVFFVVLSLLFGYCATVYYLRKPTQ